VTIQKLHLARESKSPIFPTMPTGKLDVLVSDALFSQLRMKLTIHFDEEIPRPTVNRNGQLARLEAIDLIDDAEFVPTFGANLNGA
jgi:hypothetical protein